MKWRSHSSAARPFMERAHGWIFPRISDLSYRDICRRAGRWPVRFCVRAGRFLDLALHPTPLQTATLIIAFGLIVQGYSVWKLRGALDWKKLGPFILGAALGVPVG